VTIPWNDEVINPKKFTKEDNIYYKMSLFDIKDIMENSLTRAREKMIGKYQDIMKEAQEWLTRQ
jgi:hypothetical protein